MLSTLRRTSRISICSKFRDTFLRYASTAVEIKASASISHSLGFSIKGAAKEGRPAYLDFQATTPQDPRVLDEMIPYMLGKFGNPHSRTHSFGWETDQAIEKARENVANLIGASSKEIIFTSGATESNNMSIKGTDYPP